jgi:hypothetical protein
MLDAASIDQGADLAIASDATRATPAELRSGEQQKKGTQPRIRRTTTHDALL